MGVDVVNRRMRAEWCHEEKKKKKRSLVLVSGRLGWGADINASLSVVWPEKKRKKKKRDLLCVCVCVLPDIHVWVNSPVPTKQEKGSMSAVLPWWHSLRCRAVSCRSSGPPSAVKILSHGWNVNSTCMFYTWRHINKMRYVTNVVLIAKLVSRFV